MKYTLMQFKPSGKWYQNFALDMDPEECIHGYANREDIENVMRVQRDYPMGHNWNWVMPETPWGYPIMFCCE